MGIGVDWDRVFNAHESSAAEQPGEYLLPSAVNLIEEPQRYSLWDNRRRCIDCSNRAPNGRCLAAARREFAASTNYTPDPAILRRCESYGPLPNDPDQRRGWDRWPGLNSPRKQ